MYTWNTESKKKRYQNFKFKEILEHFLKRWTISAFITITHTLSPMTDITNSSCSLGYSFIIHFDTTRYHF